MSGREEKMATNTRPELSQKNKYYISKHRYYELKHYCLQYKEWKDLYLKLDRMEPSSVSYGLTYSKKVGDFADTTGKIASIKADCARNIELIEKVSRETDEYLAKYILKSVTEELSFTYLKTVLEIPCGKDMFYDRYRKFYYLLSIEKGL